MQDAATEVKKVKIALPETQPVSTRFNLEQMLAALQEDKTLTTLDLSGCKIADSKKEPVLATTLIGHSRPVYALALLTDGRVMSSSIDRTIKLWDPKSQTCIATLTGHKDSVYALALLPDGQVISGSCDNTIKLWDLKSQTCVATLSGHSGAVRALVLLPDGRVMSGSDDHTIKLWDLKSQTCVATLTKHSDSVWALALLPDGRVISGSSDHTIKLWDLKYYTCVATLREHRGPVFALALLPDGRVLSGSDDHTIKLWDLKNQTCVASLTGHIDSVLALALLPDGRVMSASADHTLKLWDLKSQSCVASLTGHSKYVCALAPLPDGRVMSGSADNTIKLWDLGLQLLTLTDIQPLLTALKTNRTIQSLNFSNTQLDDKAVPALLELFASNQTITQLDLRATHMTAEGIQALRKALIDHPVAKGLQHESLSASPTAEVKKTPETSFVTDLDAAEKTNNSQNKEFDTGDAKAESKLSSAASTLFDKGDAKAESKLSSSSIEEKNIKPKSLNEEVIKTPETSPLVTASAHFKAQRYAEAIADYVEVFRLNLYPWHPYGEDGYYFTKACCLYAASQNKMPADFINALEIPKFYKHLMIASASYQGLNQHLEGWSGIVKEYESGIELLEKITPPSADSNAIAIKYVAWEYTGHAYANWCASAGATPERIAKAKKAFEQAREIARLVADSALANQCYHTANSYINIAKALHPSGNIQAERSIAEEAKAFAEQATQLDKQNLAHIKITLAGCISYLADLDAAEKKGDSKSEVSGKGDTKSESKLSSSSVADDKNIKFRTLDEIAADAKRYLDNKQYAAALNEYETAFELFPYAFSGVNLRDGEFSLACQEYAKEQGKDLMDVINGLKKIPEVYKRYTKAFLHYRSSSWEKAISEFEIVVKIVKDEKLTQDNPYHYDRVAKQYIGHSYARWCLTDHPTIERITNAKKGYAQSRDTISSLQVISLASGRYHTADGYLCIAKSLKKAGNLTEARLIAEEARDFAYQAEQVGTSAPDYSSYKTRYDSCVAFLAALKENTSEKSDTKSESKPAQVAGLSSSSPSVLTPHVSDASIPGCVDVDVPSDNRCWFWSVGLSWLLQAMAEAKAANQKAVKPPHTYPAAFATAYGQLFGVTGQVTFRPIVSGSAEAKGEKWEINDPKTIEAAYKMLLAYDGKKDTPNRFEGGILSQLICEVFRANLVRFMRSEPADEKRNACLQQARASYTGRERGWDEHLTDISRPDAWGGTAESAAVACMLNTEIHVYHERADRSGADEKEIYRPDRTDRGPLKAINIIHAYGSALSEQRGHYRMAPRQQHVYWSLSDVHLSSKENKIAVADDKNIKLRTLDEITADAKRYLDKKQYAAALKEYETAFELFPYAFSGVNARDGQFSFACKEYAKEQNKDLTAVMNGLKKVPDVYKHYTKAFLHYNSDSWEKAISEFEMVVKIVKDEKLTQVNPLHYDRTAKKYIGHSYARWCLADHPTPDRIANAKKGFAQARETISPRQVFRLASSRYHTAGGYLYLAKSLKKAGNLKEARAIAEEARNFAAQAMQVGASAPDYIRYKASYDSCVSALAALKENASDKGDTKSETKPAEIVFEEIEARMFKQMEELTKQHQLNLYAALEEFKAEQLIKITETISAHKVGEAIEVLRKKYEEIEKLAKESKQEIKNLADDTNADKIGLQVDLGKDIAQHDQLIEKHDLLIKETTALYQKHLQTGEKTDARVAELEAAQKKLQSQQDPLYEKYQMELTVLQSRQKILALEATRACYRAIESYFGGRLLASFVLLSDKVQSTATKTQKVATTLASFAPLGSKLAEAGIDAVQVKFQSTRNARIVKYVGGIENAMILAETVARLFVEREIIGISRESVGTATNIGKRAAVKMHHFLKNVTALDLSKNSLEEILLAQLDLYKLMDTVEHIFHVASSSKPVASQKSAYEPRGEHKQLMGQLSQQATISGATRAQVHNVTGDIQKLEGEVETFKRRFALLEQENANLKQDNAHLKQDNKNLKQDNTDVNQRLLRLEQMMSQMFQGSAAPTPRDSFFHNATAQASSAAASPSQVPVEGKGDRQLSP